MAKGDYHPVDGPFGLVDEATAVKDLRPTQLSAGRNILLRESRIAPRPGRVAVADDKPTNPVQIVNASLKEMGAIGYSPGAQQLFFSNRYGVNHRVQWLTVGRAEATETFINSLTNATGLAVHEANERLYYVENPQIRRRNFDGTGDTQLIADADNGSAGPIQGLALALAGATDYMVWCTRQHVMRAELDGSSSTAIVSAGDPYAVCVKDTALTPYVIWIDKSGAQQTIKRSALDGTAATTLYTAATGRALWGVAHNQQAGGRVFFTETGTGYAAVKSCLDDGTDLRTLVANTLVFPRHLAYDAANDELYVSDVSGTFERLFRISAAINPTVDIVGGYPVRRSEIGVEPPPPFDDFTILQLRNSTLARTDYGLRFPLANQLFLLRMGYARGGEGVPNVWCTNSRDARVDTSRPFSICAGRASMAYMGRGLDSGSGGTLIAEGTVDNCQLVDTGEPVTPPAPMPSQDEIQEIDIGAQSSGNFKINFEKGVTGDAGTRTSLSGNLAYNISAATLQLAFEAAYSGLPADFAVTNPSAGKYRIQWTGALGNRGWPLVEVVDVSLTTPANIQPVDRIQEGRDATTAAVDEVHVLSFTGHESVGTAEPFHLRIPVDDDVIETASITRNSDAAAVKAILAEAYPEIDNIDVVVIGAATTEWQLLITYAGDFSGRTFNVPEIIFDNPGVWIDIGSHSENRETIGEGVELETAALPANLGLGLPDNPYVANLCMGDTIQVLEFTGAGPITLELSVGNQSVVSGIFENDIGQDDLRDLFEGLADGPALGDEICIHCDDSGGAGSEIYTIRFSGIWSGQCVPLLKVRDPIYPASETSPPTAGAATVTLLQQGGTMADATFFLRPTNLPRVTGLKAEARTTSAPGLSGLYDYVACFNSKIFRVTSKVSDVSNAIGVHEKGIRVGWVIPQTIYFDDVFGPDAAGGHVRRAIPKLYLFRRRLGRYNKTNTIWRLRHNYHAGFIKFTITMPNGLDTGPMAFNDNAYDETGVDPSLMSSSEQDIVEAFSLAGYDVIATRNSAQDGDDDFNIEFVGSETGKLMGLPVSALAVDVLDVISGTGTAAWLEQMRRSYVQRGGEEIEADGAGASNGFYKVATIRIDPTRLGQFQYYTDRLPDSEFVSDEPAPFENDYPPRDAAYVCIHGGLAVYAAGMRIAISEAVKVGGADDGQLGGEYVRATAYEQLARYLPSDGTIRGLLSIDRILLIGGPDRVIEGQIFAPTVAQRNVFKPLDGIQGFASHWVAVKLQKKTGAIWFGEDGFLYKYDQGRADQLGRRMAVTAETLIAKTTNRREWFDSLDNWQFCSGIVDDRRNFAYFSVIKQSDLSRFIVAVDLLTFEWVKWEIAATALWMERNENSAHGKIGGDIVTLATSAGIDRLVDGKGDRGSTFAWDFSFGNLAFLGRFQGCVYSSIALDFAAREFAGSAAVVQVDVTAEGQTRRVVDSKAISASVQRAFGDDINLRDRRMLMKVSGTQADNQTHAELLGYGVGRRAEGPQNREGV